MKRIFRNIGLSSDIEVSIPTPRGSVNVDVFAIDGLSLDNIKYIVECKNWGSAIPQSVVHSFTTVMHETGVNIGFIISKRGLQSGAKEYTRNTNIVGLTYLEFQQRYFEAWWTRYFCPRVGDAADRVLQYTKEFNHHRDREYNKLSQKNKDLFDQLRSEYRVSSFMLAMFNMPSISSMLDTGTLLNSPFDLESFKIEVLSNIAPEVTWYGKTFQELL